MTIKPTFPQRVALALYHARLLRETDQGGAAVQPLTLIEIEHLLRRVERIVGVCHLHEMTPDFTTVLLARKPRGRT